MPCETNSAMKKRLLGRTNRYVYPLWARGTLRHTERSAQEEAEAVFARLLESPYEVLDITPSPALWGQLLRQHPSTLQVAIVAPPHLLRVATYSLAGYSLQAHLIETLCAIGRERVDYYFLNLSEPIAESALSGALEALELARQEGQVGALGFYASVEPLRVLSLWRTHDAFEVMLAPNDSDLRAVLVPEARARRVGVVLEWEPVNESEAEFALSETGADALLIPLR